MLNPYYGLAKHLNSSQVMKFRSGMTMKDQGLPVVASVFHTILLAYQKALKDVLNSGQAVFIHPVLETIKKLDEELHVKLLDGKNADEVLENLAEQFIEAGIVKVFRIEKLNENKYKCTVDGCLFAQPTHRLLNPEDVTCPLAMLAMAAYEKTSGRKVKFNYSKYSDTGTETIIEPL